ncbi:MAG: glycosyltransferase [Oscillospiraceae bacterium]|nr:glycosyltransferase [Oscillospiraceae bacterium]
MSKKKKKKTALKKFTPTVRLSQCMIVKNEEKNIERALAWAKDIAYEQIVVDTGSTDRTVELAKKMGAKVHHFEWINDFAAAKNYAMDLAKGDWIAILDADEYMSPEDAKELYTILKKIQSDAIASKKCDAVQCTFVNLDDKGNATSIINHQRIFRNRPDLRFTGKIHEVITLKNGYLEAPNIRILHTGYTQTSYKETNKKDRNLELLRKEHENDPENPDIMFYLADSLKSMGDEEMTEAEALFQKALNSKVKLKNTHIKQFAYNFLIPHYMKDETKKEKAIELCNEAIENLPSFIDYYYYRAVLNNQKGNYKAAQDDLAKCEQELLSKDKTPTTQVLMPSPLLLYYQLLLSAKGLNDEERISRNSAVLQMMLVDSKEQTEVIGLYIRTLLMDGATDDEVLDGLSGIYDLSNPKDMLLIARAAKEGGAVEFTRNIMKIAGQMLGDK